MKLIVDLGNTTSKFFFFSNKDLINSYLHQGNPEIGVIDEIIHQHGPFSSAIISTVIEVPDEFVQVIRGHCPLILFDERTPIPVRNHYRTPGTLGPDRLAAAVGANAMFPDQSILIIDAGTCIKYEFIREGAYQGGIISPGLSMQALALHNFTSKLPLVSLEGVTEVPLTGADTTGALTSGIINTTRACAEGIVQRYMADYPDLKIILCGGDMKYFVKWLKNSIFALPNLVAAGLNEILDFNEKKLS